MADISVNTTSTNFGLLPADLSQFGDWIGQYLPASQTLYQDQTNVVSSYLGMTNAVNAYIATNGLGAFNFVNSTELQVAEGPFLLDFHGLFFPVFSQAFNISITNTITGEKITQIGNFSFSGFPPLGTLSTTSTLAMLIDTVPNTLAPSSTWSGVVAMDATWNGTGWNGQVTGYTHSVSDPLNDKSYQTTITEAPAAISFAANTATTPGSVTLAVPTVAGLSLNVQDNAATTTFDSLAITLFSYSADSVSAPQAIPAAVAGNDTLFISGTGSLNIAGALVNASSAITGLTISDTAANVAANLDYLQTLAAQGKIGAITLTDPGSPVLTITTGQQAGDTAALLAITSPHSVTVKPPADSGLLGGLSANQQLEMVYIAYFNRAADGAGDTFWVGQNVQAQATGQSASVAVSNIANSFTPQAETIALYPFLGSANLDLSTPAAQAGLTTFINSLYGNMFGHTPDASGQSYWLGQISSGAVGLGAASLAIANGATGSDAIELTNKIAVATDFTTRTIGAGLGTTSPLPASFISVARNVLRFVDGNALSDDSVTLGKAQTTTFINSSVPGHQIAAGLADANVADPNVIVVSGSDQLIDPGAGSHTIQFLAGATGDAVVLRPDGMARVSGFNPATDALDVSALLGAANLDLNGDVAALGGYLTVVDQGADALIGFDPTGHAAGGTVAVLQGLGSTVTGLDTLIASGAIRTG